MPRPLEDVWLPERAAVWVLAPHPDDFDVIGVSLRRLQTRGHRVWVSVVSSGASGVLDGPAGAGSVSEKAALREEEQRRSLAFFGLPSSRLEFYRAEEDAAGDPVEGPGLRDRIRESLARIEPDLVFLPHGQDSNPGHRRTYAAFAGGVRGAPSRPHVLLAQDPKTLDLRVDVWTAFDAAEAAWKGELLRFHASQQARNLQTRGHGFDERILSMNRAAGERCAGAGGYAETFEIDAALSGPVSESR